MTDAHTSAAMDAVRQDGGRIHASEFALLEAKSALAKEIRVGHLESTAALSVWAMLEQLAAGGGLILHPLTSEQLRDAISLIHIEPGRVSSLRAGDALHISAARSFGVEALVTADRQQSNAAREAGLSVVLLP